MELQINITILNGFPQGTGLLYAIGELVKDATQITDLKKGEGWELSEEESDGDVITKVFMIDA